MTHSAVPTTQAADAHDSGLAASGKNSTQPRPQEFESFYLDNHHRIERALGLTLGDLELSQDAASEGFARALHRWGEVGGYENPTGWVFRVGVNWARSRRRRRRREVAPEEWLRLASGEDSEGTNDATDDDILITGALAKLSLDHRLVIVGRFYLDWSEAQIAQALDIAPGTVKSRSSRALRQLETLLGPDPTPGEDQ